MTYLEGKFDYTQEELNTWTSDLRDMFLDYCSTKDPAYIQKGSSAIQMVEAAFHEINQIRKEQMKKAS